MKTAVHIGNDSIIVSKVSKWCGLDPLVRLNASMTSDWYIALISNCLQLFVNFIYPIAVAMHKESLTVSKKPKLPELVRRTLWNFWRMEWLPSSSDMSPMMNIDGTWGTSLIPLWFLYLKKKKKTKHQEAVVYYWDGTEEHLSRGLSIICGFSSWCILPA